METCHYNKLWKSFMTPWFVSVRKDWSWQATMDSRDDVTWSLLYSMQNKSWMLAIPRKICKSCLIAYYSNVKKIPGHSVFCKDEIAHQLAQINVFKPTFFFLWGGKVFQTWMKVRFKYCIIKRQLRSSVCLEPKLLCLIMFKKKSGSFTILLRVLCKVIKCVWMLYVFLF